MRDLLALPIAGVFFLRDGRFVEVNRRFAEILAFAPDDLIGRTLDSLAWNGPACKECDRLRQGRDPRPGALSLRGRTGARVHVQIASRRTRRHGRRAVVGVAIDVGERIAAERGALRAAADAAVKGRPDGSVFLAHMSHELRTPLNAIIGFSEIMEQGIHGPLGTPQYAEYARDIRESGERLRNLIDDLLEFSRLDSGDVEIAAAPVDIGQVAEEGLRGVAEAARKAEIELELELEGGLPAILGDAPRLRHILRCLLSNAIKFTPAGGQVTLAVRRDEGELRLAVRDTGIGMDEADIGAACSPFRRGGDPLARRQEGCGLGLALTKGLCELLGGRLEIAARPGQGTQATVVLPLGVEPATDSVARMSAA